MEISMLFDPPPESVSRQIPPPPPQKFLPSFTVLRDLDNFYSTPIGDVQVALLPVPKT